MFCTARRIRAQDGKAYKVQSVWEIESAQWVGLARVPSGGGDCRPLSFPASSTELPGASAARRPQPYCSVLVSVLHGTAHTTWR